MNKKLPKEKNSDDSLLRTCQKLNSELDYIRARINTLLGTIEDIKNYETPEIMESISWMEKEIGKIIKDETRQNPK